LQPCDRITDSSFDRVIHVRSVGKLLARQCSNGT